MPHLYHASPLVADGNLLCFRRPVLHLERPSATHVFPKLLDAIRQHGSRCGRIAKLPNPPNVLVNRRLGQLGDVSLEKVHHAVPERRGQGNPRGGSVTELLPYKVVVASEIVNLDANPYKQHLEQFREIQRPERAPRYDANLLIWPDFLQPSILIHRPTGVQNTLWRAARPRSKEQYARTLFRHGGRRIQRKRRNRHRVPRFRVADVAPDQERGYFDLVFDPGQQVDLLWPNENTARTTLPQDMRCFGCKCARGCYLQQGLSIRSSETFCRDGGDGLTHGDDNAAESQDSEDRNNEFVAVGGQDGNVKPAAVI